MRKSQTSMTAQGFAIVRGIESEKDAGVRIIDDTTTANPRLLERP